MYIDTRFTKNMFPTLITW